MATFAIALLLGLQLWPTCSRASPLSNQIAMPQLQSSFQAPHANPQAAHILHLTRRPHSATQNSYVRLHQLSQAHKHPHGIASLSSGKTWDSEHSILTDVQIGSKNFTLIVDLEYPDTRIAGPTFSKDGGSLGVCER